MIKEFSSGAVVFIVSSNNKVLYLLLKNDQANYWDFPKGKVEANETKEQTAEREIHEESGLKVTLLDGFSDIIKYSFTNKAGQQVSKEVTFFLAQAFDDKVTISHEHGDYTWLPFKEAYQKITYTNSRKVLERANQVLLHII
ncbi:NUDIX domain-containing protein [bacterium]|jgi:8-oxo-dGTP pyrophosphatase MutT (NUDIX family)|nr:NUDIX domain-containing protein [bacterium]